MTMRLCFIAFLSLIPEVLFAQVDHGRATGLQSPIWEERAAAAGKLITEGHSSAQSDTALVGLLTRENQVVREAFVSGEGASAKYGEEYSEYVAKLADYVQQIADREPQLEGIWSALLNAPYDPESKFADWLSARGKEATPFLLAASRSSEPGSRGDSLLVLAKILVYSRGFPSREITPKANQEILDAIHNGLSDRAAVCRLQAVKAVGLAGTQEDIDALQRIAAADPEVTRGPSGAPEHNGFPVRDAARNAIELIRSRLHPR